MNRDRDRFQALEDEDAAVGNLDEDEVENEGEGESTEPMQKVNVQDCLTEHNPQLPSAEGFPREDPLRPETTCLVEAGDAS